MRYQAAPLPDGGFPRVSGLVTQAAFGTKRNRPAHRGTLVPALCATIKRAGNAASTAPGPDHYRMEVRNMADAFPKKILPLLEGKIGELRMMRFWSKVDMRSPDECWEWQASLTTTGYGRFKIASYQQATASRVALIGTKREEPVGLHVLHHCDNPKCCNPAHLYFGTPQQNNADKVERGRARTGDQSGAKNGAAKLTDAHLALIVERIGMGWNNTQIAADLPVSHSMVSLIRLGKMWRPQTEALGYAPRQAA